MNKSVFICALLLLSVVIVFVYFKYNPIDSKWFPQCPFKALTGLSCPACGLQRAFHALLNGRFQEALSYNLFFIISIPYLGIITIAYIVRKMDIADTLSDCFENRALAMAYVCCFFIWFVIRNVFDL